MPQPMIRSRIFTAILTCSFLAALIALAGTDVRSQSPAGEIPIVAHGAP